jgi:ribosomal protein L11 methyltransferase
MKWIEVSIETTQDASDAVCEMLAQLGADGIAVCDPQEMKNILSAPDSLAYADESFVDTLGTDVMIRAYFAEFDDGIRLGAKEEEYRNPDGVGQIYGQIAIGLHSLSDVISIISSRIDEIGVFLPVGRGLVGHRYVADEDWANSWKQYYKVLPISKRVVICPSWENYSPQKGETVVLLDPGSAFGTGTHETTALCAELIDEEIRTDDHVLDLGCGSGILSIIAKKLGASTVEAIDIDRLAVDVASANCMLNHTDVLCHTGELKNAKRNQYSFIIANIIADVIIDLAPVIPEYLSDDGRYVVSGIIDTKAQAVLEACRNAGLGLVASRQKGDWHAFLFVLSK